MRTRRLLLLAFVLACGDAGPVSPLPETAAKRPEGWTSLEGEEQATRLYYQFVDERRQVRFVESLEDVPPALRDGVGFVKMSTPPPLSPGDARRARAARTEGTAAAVRASRLVLYSADWCGACRKAKRYLSERRAEFEERNVDIPAVAEELLRKTGERGIPVLERGGRILTGFSEAAYAELLGGA
jgi:glutaredoxin